MNNRDFLYSFIEKLLPALERSIRDFPEIYDIVRKLRSRDPDITPNKRIVLAVLLQAVIADSLATYGGGVLPSAASILLAKLLIDTQVSPIDDDGKIDRAALEEFGGYITTADFWDNEAPSFVGQPTKSATSDFSESLTTAMAAIFVSVLGAGIYDASKLAGQEVYDMITNTSQEPLVHFAKIRGDGVRLRLQPSEQATVLGLLWNGATVSVQAVDGNWTQVTVFTDDNRLQNTGWVHSSLIVSHAK